MTMKPELVLAIVLVAMPFVFPHIGGSFDFMERTLDWGILGIARSAVRLDRSVVVRQAAFYAPAASSRVPAAEQHVAASGWRSPSHRRGRAVWPAVGWSPCAASASISP